MERWHVRCECGAIHTEVYPEGLSSDESYSDPTDSKECDCEAPQYELLERIG